MILKETLLSACYNYANTRIINYKNEIETINESIESNDKSNDEGDDSGNGKLFIDLEKNTQYLSDAVKTRDTLKLISSNIKCNSVVLGSIVKTDVRDFYIAIGAGKIDIEDSSYFAISLLSPIGQLLKNKQPRDTIIFNDSTYKILEVI